MTSTSGSLLASGEAEDDEAHTWATLNANNIGLIGMDNPTGHDALIKSGATWEISVHIHFSETGQPRSSGDDLLIWGNERFVNSGFESYILNVEGEVFRMIEAPAEQVLSGPTEVTGLSAATILNDQPCMSCHDPGAP